MAETETREVDFDPANLPPGEELFASLNAVRDHSPVAHSSRHGGFWIFSGYDEVTAASLDTETFSSVRGIMIPPNAKSVPALPAEADPPRHAAMRKALMPYFGAAMLRRLEPEVRRIVHEAIDDIARLGRADLVNTVSFRVPPMVLGAMLGLSDEEAGSIRSLTSDFLESVGRDPEKAKAAAATLEGWIGEEVDRRLGKEPFDVLGEIVNAPLDPDAPLSRPEIVGVVQLLIIAGHETTTNGISAMLYRLMTEEGLRQRVLADRSLTEPIVDESLRLDPPIYNFARSTVRDATVRDAAIGARDWVMLLYGAANRDPARFPDPERFVVPRESNSHVSFGWGRHRCPGAPIARLEMAAVLEAVLDRIPDITIATPPTWSARTNTQGLTSLDVRFTPESR